MIFKTSSFLNSLAVSLCLSVASPALAQNINPSLEAGINASGFTYQGDLSNSQFGNTKDMRFGAGGFVRYYAGPFISVRANLYRGNLRGNDEEFKDEWRKKRGYQFSSHLTELSVVVEVDLMKPSWFFSYSDYYNPRSRWGVSAFAGAGMAFTNTSRNWQNLDRVYFGKDATENIPKDSLNTPDKKVIVLPVGLNLHYDINRSVSIFAEAGYRLTFTDNLDGYKYAVYSQRFDGYSITSLGISYRF